MENIWTVFLSTMIWQQYKFSFTREFKNAIARWIHELHLYKILQLLCCEYSEFMLCATQIAWSLEKYLLNFHSALVQGDGQGSHRLLTGKSSAAIVWVGMHDCFIVSVDKGWGPAQCLCFLSLSVFRFHAVVFHYVRYHSGPLIMVFLWHE